MSAQYDGMNGWRKATVATVALAWMAFLGWVYPADRASAQDDIAKFVETKNMELKEKEQNLRREEERLTALRKDVDEKIAAYNKLLADVEAALKRMDSAKGERLENVVKAYEIMSPEDAAVRLSVLDETTALRILSRMKSKKAGAVIAAMAPNKAAALTRRMTVSAADKLVPPSR